MEENEKIREALQKRFLMPEVDHKGKSESEFAKDVCRCPKPCVQELPNAETQANRGEVPYQEGVDVGR